MYKPKVAPEAPSSSSRPPISADTTPFRPAKTFWLCLHRHVLSPVPALTTASRKDDPAVTRRSIEQEIARTIDDIVSSPTRTTLPASLHRLHSGKVSSPLQNPSVLYKMPQPYQPSHHHQDLPACAAFADLDP
jgi:hypothetical protein